MSSQTNNKKRVCMVTYSFYENDNRVTRYAETLAQRGDEVEVLALSRGAGIPREEMLRGVKVIRIQSRPEKKEQARAAYLWPLLRFLAAASWWLTRRHWQARFDLVHVHNIPDFLVFAAWYPKLTGAKVILDIHDIVPELFASKFGASPGSRLIRALKFVEKHSAAFAHHVILANHLWLEKYTTRSARADKCSVFLNHVDSRIFRPRGTVPPKHKPVVLFPGSLQYHQGVDVALTAFRELQRRLPQAEFHIYGEGSVKAALVKMAAELGLNGSVRFFDPVPLGQIAEVMAGADLGVVPKRSDTFGNEAYSTKIMEFMSVGVPVVVSSTKVDRYYFDDSTVRFFESGNPASLAEAMTEVLLDAGVRNRLVQHSADYVAHNSWESRKGDYLRLVDSLCARPQPAPLAECSAVVRS